MSFAENTTAIIDEYGLNLSKSRFGPLAGIEAKKCNLCGKQNSGYEIMNRILENMDRGIQTRRKNVPLSWRKRR